MTDSDYKHIYTKRRVYRLPGDAKGIPIEEAYPGARMPASLKGAVVYDTPRGRIIAHREAERGGDGTSSDAAQGGRTLSARTPSKPDRPPPNGLKRPRA